MVQRTPGPVLTFYRPDSAPPWPARRVVREQLPLGNLHLPGLARVGVRPRSPSDAASFPPRLGGRGGRAGHGPGEERAEHVTTRSFELPNATPRPRSAWAWCGPAPPVHAEQNERARAKRPYRSKCAWNAPCLCARGACGVRFPYPLCSLRPEDRGANAGRSPYEARSRAGPRGLPAIPAPIA